MKTEEPFRFSTGVLGYPIAFIMIIWMLFWVEVRFGFRLNDFGVYPRTLTGLRGIIFSPFIHGSLEHLYHNTVPLFVLSMALFYFYRPVAWKIIGYGILLSGLITWLIGRPSYHIGASGIIYVLMSFILFKGIITRHFRLIALSLLVVFLYGSMIWYVFPIKEQVSWEGHLGGLITGVLFAIVYRKSIAKPKKYAWEEEDYDASNDPFLRHFDENGNFIEKLPEDHNEEEADNLELETPPTIKVIYHIKKNNQDERL